MAIKHREPAVSTQNRSLCGFKYYLAVFLSFPLSINIKLRVRIYIGLLYTRAFPIQVQPSSKTNGV